MIFSKKIISMLFQILVVIGNLSKMMLSSYESMTSKSKKLIKNNLFNHNKFGETAILSFKK